MHQVFRHHFGGSFYFKLQKHSSEWGLREAKTTEKHRDRLPENDHFNNSFQF